MSTPRLGPCERILLITFLLLASTIAAAWVGLPEARAASPNYVSGNACAGGPNPTWQSGDTWIMYGNVTVPIGCILTIEPGAQIMGDPDVHLYIDGTLVAGGTAGTPSKFVDNQTAGIPWAGIQFNAGAAGSVTWSSFDRVLVAIAAQSSAPAISNNTILRAGAGVRLDGSNTRVADNRIDGGKLGSYGILIASSSSTLARNRINGTSIGIQAMTAGSPIISENTITNVSGGLAIGIYVTNLAAVTISGNTIQGGLGTGGGPGGGGAAAVGILANGTPSVSITGNSLSRLHGGRGGAGPSVVIGQGSSGGAGGGAAGIAVGFGSTALIQSNTLDNLTGGRGGDGGPSSAGRGGPGGPGGDGIGIEIFSASTSAGYVGNSVTNVTAGSGGDGGQPSGNTFSTGTGGSGGNAYGIFSLKGSSPDLSSNTIQNLRGGRGGNSTAGGLSSAGGVGGAGGDATGLIALAEGLGVLHANTVITLLGGTGGNGLVNGGDGGNATALLALGDGEPYNDTSMSFNRLSSVTGGDGGIGGSLSGDGGSASAISALHVNATLASNTIAALRGGAGGIYFVPTNQASRGGDAAGVSFLLVPMGTSVQDSIGSVTAGTPGTGKAPPANYGVGYYFAGNSTVTTHAWLTNATVAGIGNFTLYVDNYTEATTLNTPFAVDRVAVESAGNLTVRNFLAVKAFWPNNTTALPGVTVDVTDNAATVYNSVSPTGWAQWIPVTNRVYVNRPIPTWNTTVASVSLAGSSFAANPRTVNMTASQTQYFTMIDASAPTSATGGLPTWETTRSFSVPFTYSDGNGVGVASVSLWYNQNGTGWVQNITQAVSAFGGGIFPFTASSDGTYQFATTAIDRDGNAQVTPPAANTSWTIVDTVSPTAHVRLLPRYETSLSFAVSWAADAGVTDVASFTVQVNTGLGWLDWQPATTATSATFTATGQGPVAFRVLAADFAGNLESKTGNDTWTLVDSFAPRVVSSTPTGTLNVTPGFIVLSFSEPMNESSVEVAFSLTPALIGTFTWTNGSTTLIFQPSQPFTAGTTYSVTLGTGARDVAGNAVAQADVFSFATPAPPPAPGLSLGDLWPILVIVAAGLAALAFFLVRRRSAAALEDVTEAPKPAPAPAASKPEAAIDDVFLLYRKDGVLIKHETRRLRPDIDTDILSGMLTAVQQFVKDSFRGEEGEELNEMTVGQMHILIGRGKWLIVAATLTGGDIESMTAQIQKCVEDMETHNWDRLEEWDGDMDIAKALGPYLKKLIRGEYAA